MQVSTNYIIRHVIIITFIFLITATFFLLYVGLYNKRKKKHFEEKERLRLEFEEELVRTQMEVQEQTLQTIAGEIHDNIGQLLSLTRLTLGTIDFQNDSVKATEKLNYSIEIVSKSIKELRHLASVLHAENTLAGGLEDAIRKEIQWISRSERYKTEFTIAGDAQGTIHPKKELIIFRLIQELLNNSIKHSNALAIKVSFLYLSEGLIINISDNGKGFEVEKKLHNPTGLGLTNLFKRAKMIGGELDLQSRLDTGTNATIKIPYS